VRKALLSYAAEKGSAVRYITIGPMNFWRQVKSVWLAIPHVKPPPMK